MDNWGNAKTALPRQCWAYKFSSLFAFYEF